MAPVNKLPTSLSCLGRLGRVFPNSPVNKKGDNTMSEYSRAMTRLEQSTARAIGCKPPDWNKADKRYLQKVWRTPCKNVWQAAEEDTSLAERAIEAAVEQMKRDNLTMWAAVSVEKVAMSLIFSGKVKEKEYVPPSQLVTDQDRAELLEAKKRAEQERNVF